MKRRPGVPKSPEILGRIGAAALLLVAALAVVTPAATGATAAPKPEAPRLYWFIPDGMRADPEVFDVFRWANAGLMPNLRRMMERGSYGYSRPAFPGHTPANFATLFTGAYPEVNGVNDGSMHAEGHPLAQVSVPGFSSLAKKVEPFWVTLENRLNADITLLSIPGSTPPELRHGNTLRGRWGRWGADFHAVNFQDEADATYAEQDPSAGRLFFLGAPLSRRVSKSPTTSFGRVSSFSPKQEAVCSAWGQQWRACITDSTDDGVVNYDGVALSDDGQQILARLKPGEWSPWLPITLQWRIPGQALERRVPTQVRVKLIRLDPSGRFRLRFFYNSLNASMAEPPQLAEEFISELGPMVDFVDNFPPQLVFYPEDKATFLEEARMSLTWHRDAAAFALRRYQPQIYIQNIYTPNQMLTSRWWMGYLDPRSHRYGDVAEPERAKLWAEVKEMYRGLDEILGRMLDRAEKETNSYVVLSSDHGAIPLDTEVRLNNLFARKGWLKFSIDPVTRERTVDWAGTRVVYLKMHSVWVSPGGLAGNWKRSSGPEYKALRSEVRRALEELTDAHGVHPLEKIDDWEHAKSAFRLDPDRTGDLIIANRPGYGWSEEMTQDREVFATPLVSGYKQAVVAENEKGMWTPFVIVGPKVRKGHNLGLRPIEAVDQHPTLFRCLGLPPERWVQGRVIQEVFER